MSALYSKIENMVESESELANKERPLFRSLHEAYRVLAEKVVESNDVIKSIGDLFDMFFICIRNDYPDEANKYLNLIKNNAIYCATKMIRVAALAQKAVDSNAVKG